MTEPRFDVDALRLERLTRLQKAMRGHEVGVCVLFHEPNIRYATGASAMPVYAMSTFVRCAVVPQEGTPILFEHANSMHRSALRAPDVRPMHAWEFLPSASSTRGTLSRLILSVPASSERPWSGARRISPTPAGRARMSRRRS